MKSKCQFQASEEKVKSGSRCQSHWISRGIALELFERYEIRVGQSHDDRAAQQRNIRKNKTSLATVIRHMLISAKHQRFPAKDLFELRKGSAL